MKKLIAAAVATSVSAIAVADISITGNAKYEYFNEQTGSNAATNKSNTEVNLSIKGKKGDTGVVMNLEFNGHGSVDAGSQAATVTTTTTEVTANTRHDSTSTVSQTPGKHGTLDIEDLYMTTKVGDIAVKAGHWATGTGSLLGEIDNGARATNKIDLRTTVGGATIYAGNSGSPSSTNGNGSTDLNQNMYAGVVMNVGGATVELKHLDEDTDGFGIKGSMAGVDYRFEQKSDTVANGDTTFGEVKTTLNGVTLGYAFVDADKANQIKEDDSDIFAVEAGGKTTSTGLKQIMASTTFEGNKVTFKNGSVEKGIDASTDLDFTQVQVSRALASGANAVVTYTTKDYDATTDTDTLEVELNVSF